METPILYHLALYNTPDDVYSNDPYSNGVTMKGIKEEHLIKLLPVMAKCGLTMVIHRDEESHEE